MYCPSCRSQQAPSACTPLFVNTNLTCLWPASLILDTQRNRLGLNRNTYSHAGTSIQRWVLNLKDQGTRCPEGANFALLIYVCKYLNYVSVYMFVGVLWVYWRGEEGCDLVSSLEGSHEKEKCWMLGQRDLPFVLNVFWSCVVYEWRWWFCNVVTDCPNAFQCEIITEKRSHYSICFLHCYVICIDKRVPKVHKNIELSLPTGHSLWVTAWPVSCIGLV